MLLSEWEMRDLISRLPDVQWIKALLHCVQLLIFLFLPHLSELRFVKTKKSIILMNDAFIRVGDEGLASLVFTSFRLEPPTLPIAKHRDALNQLSY